MQEFELQILDFFSPNKVFQLFNFGNLLSQNFRVREMLLIIPLDLSLSTVLENIIKSISILFTLTFSHMYLYFK